MKRILTLLALGLTALLWISNSNNPADGRTGAPGEGLCTSCHMNPGNFTGQLSINGLPATIQPNTTYPLTVEIDNFNGGASRAGFQLVFLDGANNNIGTMSSSDGNVSFSTSNARTYAEHGPARPFSNNKVTYTLNWTSPANAADVTIYGSAIIGNGSTSSNDNLLTTTVSGTITTPTPPSVSLTPQDVTCFGGGDGFIQATVSPGTPPYSFAWSNGSTINPNIGLIADTYTVTVTDVNGLTATATTMISQPPDIGVNIIQNTGILCNGENTASLTANATGGTGAYQYVWSNLVNTAMNTGLSAGIYAVIVSDANNCSAVVKVVVSEPSPLTGTVTTTNESSNGANDGTAMANPSGGTPPYSYQWDNNQISQSISGLSAGTYMVTVSDANNCTVVIAGNVNSFNCNFTGSVAVNLAISCNGEMDGALTASTTGGQAPFTYAWSNNGNNATINNLSAGTYTVTITDAANCVTISSGTLNDPPTLTGIVSVQSIVHCNNGNDGELVASFSGGTPPYAYSWSNGVMMDINSGLSPGDYTVTVTDANGCVATETANIASPMAIMIAASNIMDETDSNADGAIAIAVTGGTGTYTYRWENSGGTTVSTMMNPTGLSADDYRVEVTDTNGCTEWSGFFTVNSIVDVDDLEEIINLSMFPNPANDILNIVLDSDNDDVVNLSILDIAGKSVASFDLENGNNVLDISNLTEGLYICRINVGERQLIRKIIIE